LFQDIFILLLPLISPSFSADEDYDVLSRDPYEYQFKVDDPKTSNRYEVRNQIRIIRQISYFCFQIAESGDPDIVKGSYRIDLPDGRTQIVTYEVKYDWILFV
jgi:hypothetical protein